MQNNYELAYIQPVCVTHKGYLMYTVYHPDTLTVSCPAMTNNFSK
jgi:hypothetical protein